MLKVLIDGVSSICCNVSHVEVFVPVEKRTWLGHGAIVRDSPLSPGNISKNVRRGLTLRDVVDVNEAITGNSKRRQRCTLPRRKRAEILAVAPNFIRTAAFRCSDINLSIYSFAFRSDFTGLHRREFLPNYSLHGLSEFALLAVGFDRPLPAIGRCHAGGWRPTSVAPAACGRHVSRPPPPLVGRKVVPFLRHPVGPAAIATIYCEDSHPRNFYN
ncbi:hypothetical protein KSP40_PGU019406 [Platanthera guangdongensis]|uniref:Uncharacterized protein n=1 Tax=Platanthera guangdongensis TaxID=2320717 RepID=A0ABR2LE98_9ASPA